MRSAPAEDRIPTPGQFPPVPRAKPGTELSRGDRVMSIPRDPLTRTLLLVFAGITSVALLIASIALLLWVKNSPSRSQPMLANNGAVAVHDTSPSPDLTSK